VEEEKSLETSALVGQFPDTVKHKVDDFLADGVVSSGVVVSGILLAVDQLLRVEELAVGSAPGFVNDGWFEVYEDSPGNVLSSPGFREECCEGIISESLVGRHMTVRLDAMLQTIKFPAGVTDLTTGLADVDRDAFTHY